MANRKWYSLEEVGSMDYAIVNRATGEREAIIAKNCGHREWIRFVPDQNGGWTRALAMSSFPSLAAVRAFYDRVHI